MTICGFAPRKTMRITAVLACSLLSLALVACSGVHIQQGPIDQFSAGNYHYYKWRTEPLPQATRSADALYAIDPIVRREVDTQLQSRGYVLDPARAQFTVEYLYVSGMLQGERSALASNISPIPSVTPNRQVNQASVDNAIALGGVKETDNIVLQFNDRGSNRVVWDATMTSIVENTNSNDASRLDANLKEFLERALQPLPPASSQ
jgi:hypothetical protein